MSETLKVRFKLNGLEFELEGNENTVKSELGIFKDFVINSLVGKLSILEAPVITKVDELENIPILKEDTPNLKEVVMKDLPKSEAEWILVYCFYASSQGKEPFSDTDIRSLYESSKRKNESRMKNFSANFTKALTNGYLRVLNGEEYILLQIGVDKVNSILQGGNINKGDQKSAEESKSKSSKLGKSKGTNKSQTFSLVSTLNLNPSGEKSLNSFFGEFVSKSFFEKNTLFVYYLERVLKTTEISINHIYTCYKHVGEKVPGNLYQSLVDTKNVKGWIDFKGITDIKVTISGENRVEHDFEKK